MKKFLLICSLIILTSCGKKELNISNIEKQNNIYYEKNKLEPFTGIIKEYYLNKKLKLYCPMIEGEVTGTRKLYYENGNIKSIDNFNKNVKNGICKKYYLNKKLKSKAIYKNGLKNGEIIGYYENGNLFFKFNYINGLPVKNAEVYDFNGLNLYKGIFRPELLNLVKDIYNNQIK